MASLARVITGNHMRMSKWLRSEYDESYLDLIISMGER